MATAAVDDLQLMREILSEREQAVMRHVAHGKAHSAIAQLYGWSEDDVPVVIEEIRAKLEHADQRAQERPLGEVLADFEDDEDHQGVPIRSVPAESMSGAGAEPPPPVAAPPGDQRQRPSSDRLPVVAQTPALARRPPNAVIGMAREQAIRDLLERRSATVAELAEEMDVKRNVIDNALARMLSKGIVVRAGSRGSSRLWALSGEEPPAGLPPLPAVRENPSMPPPASPRATEPHPVPDVEPLLRRYVELLLSYLEGAAEGGESSPEALMDRIERVLGLAP